MDVILARRKATSATSAERAFMRGVWNMMILYENYYTEDNHNINLYIVIVSQRL